MAHRVRMEVGKMRTSEVETEIRRLGDPVTRSGKTEVGTVRTSEAGNIGG